MIDIRQVLLAANGLPARTGSRSVEIRSHLPAHDHVPGQVCQCADCDGESWILFQVDGSQEVHIQCVNCGQVYCLGHDCDLPAHPGPGMSVEERGQANGEPGDDGPPPAEGGPSCLIV